MPYLRHFLLRDRLEAGCDEAGRGCLAGPVFAAAVILPSKFRHSLLNDSKQVLEVNRYILRDYIQKHALAWAVGMMDAQEIDRINILNASFGAMHRAIHQLVLRPDHLLIDGNRFNPYPGISHTCIIQGDAKYKAIAAASILAKTYRDDYMHRLHEEYPTYRWCDNKGYATAGHREGIVAIGLSPYHRLTFQQLPDHQLELFED
ncbi:MAG TPA: ribonuclease HII [Saprospiraceae bacterium]|nr:ribonuclease HII [Saprospiraceae bacterium]